MMTSTSLLTFGTTTSGFTLTSGDTATDALAAIIAAND
jgi:hypothetical protein